MRKILGDNFDKQVMQTSGFGDKNKDWNVGIWHSTTSNLYDWFRIKSCVYFQIYYTLQKDLLKKVENKERGVPARKMSFSFFVEQYHKLTLSHVLIRRTWETGLS